MCRLHGKIASYLIRVLCKTRLIFPRINGPNVEKSCLILQVISSLGLEKTRGVLPYISHIGVYRPKGYYFLRRFGLKTGIDFAHFGLESGYDTIPFGVAHTYTAYIRDCPPPPSPGQQGADR